MLHDKSSTSSYLISLPYSFGYVVILAINKAFGGFVT